MSDGATKAEPRFVQVSALARALSLHPQTLRSYIHGGLLRAVQVQKGARPDIDAPRKTMRGRWLVELGSVEELLTQLYSGRPVPAGLLRRLRRHGQG